MTYFGEPARTSWRDSPLIRVLGSAASWFLFTMSFTLLYLASTVVMGLGGSCASGGPYEIAVECPDNVALAPVSVFIGLFAVGISIFFAQGFGVPLTTWGWPILFVGLGLAFLLAQDVVGYIIGAMFLVMGLVPLVLELRASPQRVFLGQRSATGLQFDEGPSARRSLLSLPLQGNEGSVRPTAIDWVLSLGIAIATGWAGYVVAVLWFGGVPA